MALHIMVALKIVAKIFTKPTLNLIKRKIYSIENPAVKNRFIKIGRMVGRLEMKLDQTLEIKDNKE